MGVKKNFVLDTKLFYTITNVFTILKNDIYIPIVVLEELDKFKKGNDQINFNAVNLARNRCDC